MPSLSWRPVRLTRPTRPLASAEQPFQAASKFSLSQKKVHFHLAMPKQGILPGDGHCSLILCPHGNPALEIMKLPKVFSQDAATFEVPGHVDRILDGERKNSGSPAVLGEQDMRTGAVSNTVAGGFLCKPVRWGEEQATHHQTECSPAGF